MAEFLKKLFRFGKSGAEQIAAPSKSATGNLAPATLAVPSPVIKSDKEELEQVPQAQGAALLELACKGSTSRVRLAAVQHLIQEEELDAACKALRSKDKGAYQLAKQKLDAIRTEKQAAAEQAAATVRLLQQLEGHARSDNTQLYAARLEVFESQWCNLAAHAAPELIAKAEAAIQSCRTRLRNIEEAAALELRQQQQQIERRATLATLEETLTQLGDVDNRHGIAALDAVQRTQTTRWEEASEDTEVTEREFQRYWTLMEELRAAIDAVRQFEAISDRIRDLSTRLADEATESEQRTSIGAELQAQLDSLDWPAQLPRPGLLKEALQSLKRLTQAATAPTPVAKIPRVDIGPRLKQLEQQLEQRQLKESRQTFKEIQKTLEGQDGGNGASANGHLQLLTRQLKELEDWHGFAVRPKQEALCVHMEALARQGMEPAAQAQAIRDMQQEWRALGGSSDQTIWQRFKQAADKAYEPCQAWFAERDEQLAANLTRRNTLCEQLTELLEQIDWSQCDWAGLEKITRAARDEWKSTQPVDFKASKSAQKRFNTLLEKLDAALDGERDRNTTLKKTLVESAQGLISHEPLQEAMERAKSLQKDWQKVGITRHRDDRALWQDFRAVCDNIFKRREQERHATVSAQEQAHVTAEDLLAQMRQAPATAPSAQLDTWMENLQALPLSTESRRTLLSQARNIVEASARQQDKNKEQSRKSDWQTLLESEADVAGERLFSEEQMRAANHWLQQWPQQRKNATPDDMARELCVRADIACGLTSRPEDQPLRLELQVRRLNEGLQQGRSWVDSTDELGYLLACWQGLRKQEPTLPVLHAQHLLQALKTLG